MTKFRPENEFFEPDVVMSEAIMPPIDYNIETSLGSFNVTRAASEAYGLVPLQVTSSGAQFGNSVQENGRPYVNITLVSPEEFVEHTKRTLGPDIPTGVEVPSETTVHQEHIDIMFCFSKTKAQSKQELMGIMQAALEDSDLAEVGVPTGPNGESIDEVLEQSLPQQYAHAMTAFLLESVMESLVEHDRGAAAQRLIERIKLKGNIALIGSGVVLAVTSLLNDGRLSIPGVLGATVYYAVGSAATREDVEVFAKNSLVGGGTAFGREQNPVAVTELAHQVHQLFCSTHFNAQAGGLFGAPDDDRT